MTKNEAVEYVRNNVIVLPPFGGRSPDSDWATAPYAVTYEDETFWGKSYTDLVNQILDFVNGSKKGIKDQELEGK